MLLENFERDEHAFVKHDNIDNETKKLQNKSCSVMEFSKKTSRKQIFKKHAFVLLPVRNYKPQRAINFFLEFEIYDNIFNGYKLIRNIFNSNINWGFYFMILS